VGVRTAPPSKAEKQPTVRVAAQASTSRSASRTLTRSELRELAWVVALTFLFAAVCAVVGLYAVGLWGR
jgi:hypothetical protein